MNCATTNTLNRLISSRCEGFRILCSCIVIVNQFCDTRVFTAKWAIFISRDFHFAIGHTECIIKNKPANKRFTDTDNILNCFRCHHHANYAWEHAQDTSLTSAWHQARWWRCGIHASVARTLIWFKERNLPLKLKNTAVNNRFVHKHRSIVDEETGSEVIASIHN